jgi:hypothetical protein
MTTPPAIRALLDRTPSPGAWASGQADRAIAGIVRRAPAGSPAASRLDRALRLPIHALLAWTVFSFLLFDAASAQNARGYPAASLALVAIPAGLLLLRRPLLLGLVMAAASVYLRALYLGIPETCDQMAVSRAALGVIDGGGNPWGFGYAESVPPGAPYPYGPLAAFTSLLGVPGEVAAMGAILVLLAWQRALLTLAFLGAWVAWIELGVCGINDQVPALLLLGGLLLLEKRRLSGALLVALSVGIKPYSFAWVPPLMGYGGLVVSLVLLGGVAVTWAPLLLWGPRSYLDSIEMARGIHPRSENTLNMPALRILALPVAIAALLVRSWSTAVLTGALIFMTVLFLDFWASFGYWLVVLPPVGIVLERSLLRFGARLRAAIAAKPAEAPAHATPASA